LYTKMEVCSAGNLLQYISRAFGRSRRIPPSALWDWGRQAAEGLRFLHACGYVHLDVKPDNIFVEELAHYTSDKAGDATSCTLLKIGDLGLACRQGKAKWETNGDSRYVAPELLTTSTTRLAASDVFSLGMLLLQLAATTTLPREGVEWSRLRQVGAG
jgi:mitosis inhibitor protein kinase SWE1